MTPGKGRRAFQQHFEKDMIQKLDTLAKQRGCRNKQELLRAVMIPDWLERHRKSLKLRMMIV